MNKREKEKRRRKSWHEISREQKYPGFQYIREIIFFLYYTVTGRKQESMNSNTVLQHMKGKNLYFFLAAD
jgi:hypothetical protein